jgi:hypothetical protein
MVEAFRRKRNISPNRAEFRVRGYRERSATALEIWPTSQSAFHTPQRRFRRIYHSSVHLDASEKLSDTLVEHDLNCTLQISAQHGLLRDDKLTSGCSSHQHNRTKISGSARCITSRQRAANSVTSPPNGIDEPATVF